MKKLLLTVSLLSCIYLSAAAAGTPRTAINLNGIWEFDQTALAFPPGKFTRKIPVPGLVHLALPRIEEYDKFFKTPGMAVDAGRKLLKTDYTPRYSWYRKKIAIGEHLKGQEAVLTIKKSQYVTQVFVNGIDLGSYVECYTPIDVVITRALKLGQENEILVKTGDRYWLPSSAAGGTDKEKEHYLPGIWDDVLISFTKKVRVNRLLALPKLKENKVTVKAKLWNLNLFNAPNDPRRDKVEFQVNVYEKKSRKLVGSSQGTTVLLRDQQGEIRTDVLITNPHPWSPDDPFLYTAEITVRDKDTETDKVEKAFGMRDFERRGKSFYLN
ncbi:MAG TPA: hypothetical protein VGD31_07615, partial [Sphingobacteriaceae bacterium]